MQHFGKSPSSEVEVTLLYHQNHTLRLPMHLQISNDIAKAQADIAAAEKRQQAVLEQVQQAKQGKEDTVRLLRLLQRGRLGQ